VSIDHKQAAEDLTAYHDARIGGDWTPINDSEVFALAQVHATLALAEQQRLANLIALAALNFSVADFTKTWDSEKDTNAWRFIRASVVEGLGIE